MHKFIISASMFVYDGFLYDLFFALGFVAVFLFYLWRGKYFGVKPIRSVLLVLIVYPSVVLWMYIQYWLETGSFGGNNIVRVFVYMPLFAIPASKILKLNWQKSCDMLAPATCVVHGVSHWGCMFAGCCQGFPVSRGGLFNPKSGRFCFPSQPLEALTAILIVAFLLWRERKNNYRVDGLSMPIMLMLFGFTRFFWEFFRDNEKLWLGCSSLAFHALFMGIVGLIMYVIIKKYNKKKELLAA